MLLKEKQHKSFIYLYMYVIKYVVKYVIQSKLKSELHLATFRMM